MLAQIVGEHSKFMWLYAAQGCIFFLFFAFPSKTHLQITLLADTWKYDVLQQTPLIDVLINHAKFMLEFKKNPRKHE